MDDFFNVSQSYQWLDQNSLYDEDESINKLCDINITKSKDSQSDRCTENDPSEGFTVVNTIYSGNSEVCDTNRVPESGAYVRLSDPPNINEILTCDETLIQSTSHNVGILNSACQEILKEMEQILLNHLKKNRREQEIILNYLNSNGRSRNNFDNTKKVNFKCLGIPYFKDKDGYPPPLNRDVLQKKKFNKLLPEDLICGAHIWNSKDSKLLVNAIHKCVKNKCTNECIDANDVDWMQVSAKYMDGKYSPSECKSKWILHLRPEVNKSPWKYSESMNFKHLVEKYKKQNWDKIAEELGTKRTGFQCYIHYQSQKGTNIDRWTKKEDETLLSLIKKFKIKDYIPWKKITWNFEGRSLRQCQERYAYHLQDIKKGLFTIEEDYLLVYLYSKIKSFKEVAKFFPSRVSTQIRSRYEYLVRQTMPKFTKEEDELLTQLVGKYSRNWGKISEFFEYRSKLQCRGRWAVLQKKIPIANDNESDSEIENTEIINFEANNIEQNMNPSDVKNVTSELLQYSLPLAKTTKKKFSESYMRLLEYCKNGYKFLLGPKPKLTTNPEDLEQLCFRIKIIMKNLHINPNPSLSSFDIDSLSTNCEFDVQDFQILQSLKKSNETENGVDIVELCHNVFPPNFITLVGLRSLLLQLQNIKNWSHHYENSEIKSNELSDRILYSDAKKLFKSRLKTLFAFPLILSYIPVEGINCKTDTRAPKIKKCKPLSRRKRRNHGKMMQECRKKLQLLNKKYSELNNSQTVAQRNLESPSNDLEQMQCKGTDTQSSQLSEIGLQQTVGRKRGRPPKVLPSVRKETKLENNEKSADATNETSRRKRSHASHPDESIGKTSKAKRPKSEKT